MTDLADSTYWIIQYDPDPFRHEPRNIGVFLHDGKSARCLMLGEKKDSCDPRYFCYAFGIDEDTGWVYREWSHWFRTLTGNGIVGIESVHAEFERLRMRGVRFGVTSPTAVSAAPGMTQDSLLKELFTEYVNVPRLPDPSPIERDFDRVLSISELMFDPAFHRDVEVELGEGAGTAFVHFDALLEKPEPLGIKVVQLQRVRELTMIGQINDALYSFETSFNQGFLTPDRCIVLHDRPPSSRAKHLDRLSRHARLLPLWDEKTPSKLRRIAFNQ